MKNEVRNIQAQRRLAALIDSRVCHCLSSTDPTFDPISSMPTMETPKPTYIKAQSFSDSPHAHDRRFAYTRQTSFIDIPDHDHHFLDHDSDTWKLDKGGDEAGLPFLAVLRMVLRSGSRPMRRLLVLIFLNVAYSSGELCIGLLSGRVDIPHNEPCHNHLLDHDCDTWKLDKGGDEAGFPVSAVLRMILRSGSRPMRRLLVLIFLNVAYSSGELGIGLLSGRVGLVSDAFHLTFGCGLLTFSLFAMAASRKKPDRTYTYGYKRLEVLSAFTNALFLLFMSFSLAVEALHAFIQDESEHKHYLIVSAVTNLLVNLIGVWFFRSYARINLAYRSPEDMNNHSVCLHVLADSIRSAGLILASWLLSLGVNNAEVLCLGLVSVTVFVLVMPLFKVTGSILLQTAPPNIPPSALGKCWRQVMSMEDVSEVSQARLWELVPGHVVGSISLQVKKGIDDRPILRYVHGLYHDLGVQNLTVQTDNA